MKRLTDRVVCPYCQSKVPPSAMRSLTVDSEGRVIDTLCARCEVRMVEEGFLFEDRIKKLCVV